MLESGTYVAEGIMCPKYCTLFMIESYSFFYCIFTLLFKPGCYHYKQRKTFSVQDQERNFFRLMEKKRKKKAKTKKA